MQVAKEPATNNNRKKWTNFFYANRMFYEDNALHYIQPEAECVALGAKDVDMIKTTMGTAWWVISWGIFLAGQ